MFEGWKKFPLLEPDVIRQEPAEAGQRLGVVLPQAVEQRPQPLMFLPCAPFQRAVFPVAQQGQKRLLLELEMRLQFSGKGPEHAQAGGGYLLLVARLHGAFAGLRQSEGGVMFPRQWLQGRRSLQGRRTAGVMTKTSGSSACSSRMRRTRPCHSCRNSATSSGVALFARQLAISAGTRGEAGTHYRFAAAFTA